MNRLALLDSPTATHQPLDPRTDQVTRLPDLGTTSATEQSDCPVATFAPIHYEEGYPYPLLVWLHGPGGSEQHLRDLMPHVSMRNYVAVAPQGTVTWTCRRGYSWGHHEASIELAAARVARAIELAQARFHIHPRRIFVAGHGCGGTMGVRLAWRFPEMFAGVASLAGGIPAGYQPLRNIKRMRRLPLLLSAGIESSIYRQQHVCRDLRLLHAAGAVVSVRQYPCGDELRTPMLNDLDRWMMDIVCQTAVQVQA